MRTVDLEELAPQDADAWETADRSRGRVLGVLAAVGLAVVVALGSRSGVVTAGPADDAVEIVRSGVPLTVPEVPETGSRSRTVVTAAVDWGQATGAPLGTVADAPVLAMGDAALVLGSRSGRVGLAQIAPGQVLGTAGAEAWELLAELPLAARSGPLLAAAEDVGVVVWGGREGVHGTGMALDDGAVRAPGSDEWTALPDLPVRLGPVRGAALTDDGMLVVVGVPGAAADSTAPAAWAWTPGDSSWTSLPPPPVDELAAVSAVGVGRRAFVTGIRRPDTGRRSDVVTLSYDPAAGAWTSHELVPLRSPHETVLLAVDADSVLMWGRPSTNDLNATPDGLVLDLETGAWRQMPSAPLATNDGAPTVATHPEDLSGVWTGQELVLAGGGLTTALLYDPSAGTWVALPPPPGVGRGSLAFTGGRLVWWGRSAVGPSPTLLVLPDGLQGGPGRGDSGPPATRVSAAASAG